jgi:hypothetical protein
MSIYGIIRHHHKTACISCPRKFDISLLTPVSSPRVLNNSVFGSVTHSNDGVIKILPTSCTNNSWTIELKGLLVCLNRYSGWVYRNSRFQSVLIILFDLHISSRIRIISRLYILGTPTIFCSVRISSIYSNSVHLSVFECLICHTSVTSRISVKACTIH